jgi:hypothetical protein
MSCLWSILLDNNRLIVLNKARSAALAMLDNLVKFCFPNWQRWQRQRNIKIFLGTVLAGIVVAVITGAMIYVGNMGHH